MNALKYHAPALAGALLGSIATVAIVGLARWNAAVVAGVWAFAVVEAADAVLRGIARHAARRAEP